MPENSPPDMTIPPIYLPGLKLRTVNKKLEPSTALQVLADAGAPDSDHKDVVIYLKHFDLSLFKLFPGQDLSLAVTYTGGIKDEPAFINVYEVEESDAGGEDDDEEALMDETLGDNFEVGTEGEEEGAEKNESVELDLITVDYEHTASPVDGYYCFHLRVEDDWSSPDKVMKTLETIEVSVAVHGGEGEENPADISDEEMAIFDFGNVKTRHGSMVGESFVIDLLALEQTVSEKGKDSARVFFLDWNWSDVLMRQVFSPQELQSFDNEKLIPQGILFLGAADNKQYNPLQDLKLHVNLFGFEGLHEDLVIKIYNGVDLNLSLKKSASNALEDAMKGAADQLDLVPSTISANVEGWVTFEFGVENILHTFLARYVTEFPILTSMSRAGFEHILDPDSHKSDEEERLSSIIIDIITSIRLSVVIEDSSGIPLSKFLLDAIESNDMYYDSAVKLLQNSDNWVKEKLIKWSTMATLSSLTDLNCLYRFAQFKLSEKESIPLVDLSSEVQNQHTFEVTVNLPNIEVDPNTLCLLVRHSNGMLHFQNEDPSHKFKYLTSPTIGADGNDSVTFKWISTNPTNAAGKVDVTISLLISPGLVLPGEEPSPDNHKKIGSSVSFSKQIGHTSEKHFASLRIRRSIALGIEEASPLEESVANFLEGFFQLVFKISGLEDFLSRSELENSSDEIGTAFYRMMLQQDSSMMWRVIMASSVFQSNPIDPDYDEGQNNTETAEVLIAMFDALLHAYSGSLRNVIRIILDEKGLKETDENYEEEFESFRGKFSAVFHLSTDNLASDLARFPTTKAKFISAGRILSEEIEEFTNSTSTESEDASYSTFSRSFNLTGTSSVDSAYEVLVDSGLKMDRRDFEKVINKPIQALDQQSRHVSREIDRMAPHLFNLSSAPVSATSRAAKMTSMAATMEDKLMRMLNSAEDAGSDVTSVLETTQSAIEDIMSPIDSLDAFRSTFSSLASQAKSLEGAIRIMIPIILKIGARCPLWPVKALVNIIKNPLNMLKSAAKRGKDTIVRLNNNLSRQLRTLLRMRSKISNLTGKLDAPKGAIEKFQEIISMLSTLAASGLLPVNLISKFIESTTLESFFDVLKSNTKSMKDLLEGCNREIQKVSRFFPSITSLLNSIREKFNFMRPIDNLFRTLKPWVDKAVALFNRTFSWWTRWLFDVILKPIEWAISFILSPFKNIIRGMVEKINPFGGIQFLQNIGNGIGGVISQFNGIDSKILDIVSFNSIPGFHSTTDILANGLAIVLRAMYTLLSQAIEQGADSIEFLEDMISESDAMDSLMELLQKEKSSNESVTLSTVLLEMKAQSIDGPSARIDTYLKNNVSSNPFSYNDNTSGMISKFINYDASYDLVPCFLSPLDDAKTPYFERAKHFSWLTAPLAGILHHKLLIEHAESLQLNCNDFTKISDTFVPRISADGRCTIRLFENFSSVHASPTYIDTRLPVKKASLTLPNDVTNIAASLVDFISKKVFSPIHESFSLAQRGSCSWALLEKVVICKGATKSWPESIGSGVHLLTGLKEAVYYAKNRQTNSFTMYNVSLFGPGFRPNASHFNRAQQAPIPNNTMIAHLRNCTLSMGQINMLKSAGQSLEGIDETKKSETYEQMKNLKMFIVRDYYDEDHPIICHDETEERNILCSTGVLLQPLMGLNVKEIWEYTIGTTYNSPSSITNSAMLTPSANVARSLRSDIAMRKRGRGASVRSSGDFMLRPSAGSGLCDRLVQRGISGAPSSSGGSPIVRSGASVDRAEVARLFILISAEKTVSEFSGLFVGSRRIQKRCIVVLKLRALRKPVKERYKYKSKKSWVQSDLHIVTSDHYTNPYKRNEKCVTLKRVGREYTSKNVVENVAVSDLELVDDDRDGYRTNEVLRELGLFPNEGIKTLTENIQGKNPEQWGMTLRQFRDYVKFCKDGVINVTEPGKLDYLTTVAQSTIWRTLKKPSEFEKDKDWVNAHDLNKEYIMKQTKGTGMGIALNMQTRPKAGNHAVVMLSHAWNEDMSQLLLMLEEAKNNELKLLSGEDFGDDTVLWFCCFAQFQVNRGKVKNDNLGPLLSEQMALNPFEEVIRSDSCTDMIVLQTTTYDPNTRFWCVLELYEALKKKETEPFNLHYLFSKNFLKTFVKREKVPTVKKWVQTDTGWSLTGPGEGGNTGNMVINPDGAVFEDTIPKYKLMGVNDTVTLTDSHINNSHQDKHTWDVNALTTAQKLTLNFEAGKIWPKLKYDIFMSKRKNDGWEDKFIDVGDDARWKEMQETIVTFQRKSALDAMKRNLKTNFKFW